MLMGKGPTFDAGRMSIKPADKNEIQHTVVYDIMRMAIAYVTEDYWYAGQL